MLNLLACPRCGAELTLSGEQADRMRIATGTLTCTTCAHSYAIVNGVPRLNEELAAHQLLGVARTFGYEWEAHHRGEFEDETLFGRTREQDWEMVLDGMGISEADVRGAVVLDAGCGSGRFCQLFADHGASLVIGVDMNDAVDAAARSCSSYANVHIVQANIFALPFKPGSFGHIWCNGVLHHTPDPAGAHRSLAGLVAPSGVLYVWVYPKRFSPFNLVKRIFDLVGVSRLPPRALQLVANLLSYPSIAALWLYRGVRSLPGLGPRTKWGERTVRPRTLTELRLTWFDTISPEFDSTHTEDEVIGWFREAHFQEIATLEEPKIGVRGVAPAASLTAP